MTIIGGGLYLVLRRLGMGFRGSAILGGVLVASYGILTGKLGLRHAGGDYGALPVGGGLGGEDL